MKETQKNRSVAILAVIWGLSCLLGFAILLSYSYTPSANVAATTDWPSRSSLVRDSALDTLVVFVHPKCACSNSTLWELERIAAHAHGRMTIAIVMVKPPGVGSDWWKDRNWAIAKRIPGARVYLDEQVESERFSVRTSGQTLLFSKEGRMLFAGGITPSRGHMGDSDGKRMIYRRLANEPVEVTRTQVFGCSLKSREHS